MVGQSQRCAAAVIGLLFLFGAACTAKETKSSHPSRPAVKAVASKETSDMSPADQRTILILGGRFCEFYRSDVETALRNVQGVKEVDFKTIRGHVLVTFEAGNVNPVHLLSAVSSVKGEGYYCKARVMPE